MATKSGDKKRHRDAEEAPAGTEAASEQNTNPPTKKARLESRRELFVRSLPPTATNESLTEFFSQHYPVKHATVVVDPKTKTSRGYGFVSFTDPEDALEAKEKLNNVLFEGRRLKLDIAQPRLRDASKADSEVVSKVVEEKRKREAELAEARKPPKLIIRNLPWSIKTADQLAKLFQPFGKIKYADLPNSKGKLAGFGFVTLRGRKNAQKAMEAINGKVVDGRTLAVDWAVDKQTWEQQKAAEETKDSTEGTNKSPKNKNSKKSAKDEEEDKEDKDMTQEDRDLMNFFKNYGQNLEDEESDSDAEDRGDEVEDEEEEKEEEDQDEVSDESGEGEEDEEADGDSGTEGSDVSDEEEDKPKKLMTDNSTTLFIRNLPYTTTDETLKAHFAKFGPVRYARVVMDRTTDRPAGTGFVCFFNLEDCKACLKGAPRHNPAPTLAKHSVLQDETADPEGKYTLEGRVLQVAQAVSKDEATRLAEEKPARKGKEKDKRRLFLLSEGTIPKNSPLYNKLSPAEIKMREASAKQRKKLIESNPSLHLSLTRLAVRNIPHNLSSKDLKALARQAIVGFAKDIKEGRRQPLSKEEMTRGGEQDKEAERRRKQKGVGVVRQAKIVFETKEGSKVDEKTGGGKSRGYGFIEYWSHPRALMGLRWLNGHPLKNEAGKTQRLIVEFAIENANVVQRRRAQEERSRQQRSSKPSGAKEKEKEKETEAGGGKAKGAKKGKGGKRGEKASNDEILPDKEAKKKAEAKLAMRTKIIARKRMMRKKKAKLRGGKK
ncbi:hypothetical protein VTK56DRAFT_4475 [Thermocarpiscus australiensis]